MAEHETATLAGGCFWCLEAAFDALAGVIKVEPGYMGGQAEHPTYEQVCGGRTGHAEVVRIRFDPDSIGFKDLLEVFFSLHDPTQLNRQGNDIGTQYRSAIFCHSPAQQAEAEATIDTLRAEAVFDAPIVTEVVPAATFWPAENYHRDYFNNHPEQPYCQAVVSPKVAKIRTKFAQRLKKRD
jgi:peptide-methionine (S)-S-oxide reductase